MAAKDRESYDWLNDPFDEKKAAAEAAAREAAEAAAAETAEAAAEEAAPEAPAAE